jgi:hypothetical protein
MCKSIKQPITSLLFLILSATLALSVSFDCKDGELVINNDIYDHWVNYGSMATDGNSLYITAKNSCYLFRENMVYVVPKSSFGGGYTDETLNQFLDHQVLNTRQKRLYGAMIQRIDIFEQIKRTASNTILRLKPNEKPDINKEICDAADNLQTTLRAIRKNV